MPANPAFFAARSAEQRQRLLSYLPFAEPLALPLSTGRVVHVPQVHFTLRCALELRLVGNPFLVGGRPTVDDVLRYLWRLHPDFIRPDGSLPNRRDFLGRPLAAGWLQSLRSAWASFCLGLLAGRLLWPAGALLIRDRIAQNSQDADEADDSGVFSAAPAHCDADDHCAWFMPLGFTRDQVLDAPVAWLLQYQRATALAGPDGDCEVIDKSDRFLAVQPPADVSPPPSSAGGHEAGEKFGQAPGRPQLATAQS